MKKLNKITAVLAITTVFLLNGNLFVYAQALPQEPSAPSAPKEPATPSAPQSPKEPVEPSAPKAPQEPALPKEPTLPIEPVVVPIEEYAANENNLLLNQGGMNGLVSGSQNGGGNTNSDVVVNTGSATTSGIINNIGNSNLAASQNSASLVPAGGSSIIKNADNGANSSNSGVLNQNSSSVNGQTNSATVKNDLNQFSNSGDNVNNSNTGGSVTINTGNANTSGSIVNMLNTNASGVVISEFNIADNHTGDYILDFNSNCILGCYPPSFLFNSGNGSGSGNSVNTSAYSDSATFQNNTADIENNMNLLANTGNNTSDRNTGTNSSINTGNANVSANIANFANNNLAGNVYLGVVNIYGNLNGDIVLPSNYTCSNCSGNGLIAGNSGNGDNSTSVASVNSSDNYLLSQTNAANIQNNININAETGNNSTSRNTNGENSIQTGEANILTQVLNVANNNIAGGDWWLVIVNEAGNWIGKILGAPEGSSFAASSGMSITSGESGEIIVNNIGNGENSNSSIAVNQLNVESLEQSNNANIVNNVNLMANTGGNSASRNTGGSNSITTGDANVILNIINFVNNNVSGNGRLFVTLVNVFGSWIGDFVTPGSAKEPEENNGVNQNNNAIGGNTAPLNATPLISSSNSSSSVDAQPQSQSSNVLLPKSAKSGRYSYSPRQSTVKGLGDETKGDELAMAKEVAGGKSESANSLNINLAWLLLLVPLYLIIRVARKRILAR